MIIYPPYIADTIPGFLTTEVKIPFEMNPGVSWNNISGFKLQIKEYNGDSIIATISKVKPSSETNELSFTNFSGSWAPTIGQYYKFQLAYMESNEDTNLTFSSASIGKCVGKTAPTVNISTPANTYYNTGVYIGTFTPSVNFIDKLYSYNFILTNNNEIIEDSGEIYNYNNNDYIYKLKYEIPETIPSGNDYKIQFFITTINGYKASSTKYNIGSQTVNLDPNQNSIQLYNINAEKKYITIKTKSTNTSTSSPKYFLLERTQDKINHEQLIIFEIPKKTTNNVVKYFKWNDLVIESGIKYYYSIREVNAYGQYLTLRTYTTSCPACQYEDIFLTDINGKQLCIKFDPKISSFKDTIQEQKVETIGSRYPYFFRNGQIKYKEIPISGLISYWMDENGEFMNDKELGLRTISNQHFSVPHKPAGQSFNTSNTDLIQRSINLDGYNFAAERRFKLKVLDWLNDGTPKLLCSPAEGVYVIRLMNVSLSPNDTLGRMIHSFSATGYEVSDHDIETLKKAVLPNNTPITSATRLGWFITCEETAS